VAESPFGFLRKRWLVRDYRGQEDKRFWSEDSAKRYAAQRTESARALISRMRRYAHDDFRMSNAQYEDYKEHLRRKPTEYTVEAIS